MGEEVELEAWFISSVSKTNYPTGTPNVKPISISANVPFKLTNPYQIAFFKKLIKCNPNGPFRRVTEEEVKPKINYDAIVEEEDKYIKTHATASKKIAKLEDEIKNLKSDNNSKETSIESLKNVIADMKEKIGPMDELSEKYNSINAKYQEVLEENEKYKLAIKKLKKENKKLKGE